MPDEPAENTDLEHSERIIELFNAALELPPEERAAFLNEACAGNDELRREVESLLDHTAATGPLRETSAMKLAARRLAKAQQRGEIPPNTIIHHYCILKPLGAGGMGEVYLAEDTHLQRRVALKFLTEDFAADVERVRRFQREALTVSRLQHPNIVTIYEHFSHDGRHVIATEFVEGETLRQYSRHGAMDWREVTRIAAQIAGALHAAHAANIIHRDIKPENVIRQANRQSGGHIKVLDFGIAKHIGQIEPTEVGSSAEQTEARPAPVVDGSEQTRTGHLFYTPAYASPEQARGDAKNKPDTRTDIFSLAVLTFELLTGERPFVGATPQEQIAALLSNEEAPDVRTRCPQVPAALAAIIAKALRKSREERYDKAGEMLADLEELKNDLAVNETGELIVTKSANRLLTQFTILSLSQPQTRIPLGKLWTIWHRSNLKRGAIETGLMWQSLRSGLLRAGAWALVIALVAVCVAAAMSITNQFGDERVLRDGSTAGIRRAIFSPDGHWLIAVGEDNRVRVWDFARRELHKELTNHQGSVVAASFAPDGKYFATASWDQTVIVWDAATFAPVTTLRDHREPVTGVTFSPDGKYLVSASKVPDDRTVLWRVGSWEKVRDLPLWGGDWAPLLFAPREPRSLFAYNLVANVETGQREKELDRRLGFHFGAGVAFSRDGSRAVTVDNQGIVHFIDALRWKGLGSHPTHRDHGRGVAFSPDGKLVATGAEDIALWNAATQELITRWDYSSYVWSLTWSPDGRYLVSTHGDGSILLWDIMARERAANLTQHSLPVGAVAFAPDGQRVASGSEDRSIIIWNLATGHKEAVLLGHESRINSLSFGAGGKWLATDDQSGELRCWDIAAQRVVWRQKHEEFIGLAISSDGRLVADAYGVYVGDTGELIHKYEPVGFVVAVSFSGDGQRLATVGKHRLQIFDTQSWELRGQHETGDAPTVSFAPDGKHLVTGNISGEVTLWQAEPLRPLAILGRHTARVKQVSFSPDNHEVVSAGDDKTVRLWDIGTRRQVQEIGTHAAGVLSVAFSPDWRQIVTGEHDKSVRIYTRKRTLWGWPLN